jgi:alkaline phosphatase
MVEGSKIDWAAHANDPVGIATDFLAFDRACGAALEFARKNGETAVVILPDHGNSGISLGVRRCTGYDKLTKDQLFLNLSRFKLTASGFAAKLNSQPASEVQNIFRQYAGFELSQAELKALHNCKGYTNSPIPEAQRSAEGIEASLYSSGSLSDFVSQLITSKTCIGFTTGGHTGEEVFLAAYHPEGTLPTGMHTNIELNAYLCALFGFDRNLLDELTNKQFARHTDVFKGKKAEIIPAADEKSFPTLIVKGSKKQLTVTPFTNIATLTEGAQSTELRLPSVVIYVDKNQTFYLPTSLSEQIE